MKIQENVPLSRYTSYRIGGPARYFFAPKTLAELKRAISWAKKERIPIFILGGGTNLLVGDAGFKGAVIQPRFASLRARDTLVEVGAGVMMEDLLAFVVKKGLSGLEWAGGLPGTVGGAVRGNAGAFGGEIKDSVISIEYFDVRDLKKKTRTARASAFGYRSSIFKARGGREVILSVTLRLRRGTSALIKRAIREKIAYRQTRHPLEHPNVGSIFKNVDFARVPRGLRRKLAGVVKQDPFPIVPTAYLLSESSLKGVSFGGAMISPKHPNFIVNVLGASAGEVKQLIALAKSKVREKFQILLEEEVQFLPPQK